MNTSPYITRRERRRPIMSFWDTLSQMLVILFAIAAGYAANALGYLGEETDRRISKIILNISMPCMIVAAVMTGEALPDPAVIFSILKVGVIFYGMEFLFACTVPRLLGGTPGEIGVWRFALAFPNVGFIGYPVVMSLFGPDALFYAVVLALPFNLLSFTFGPLMLVGAKNIQLKQMFSPCVIASLIGLALALTGTRPPMLVGECLSFVGDLTVPLSLMVVGSLLAALSIKSVFSSPRLWAVSALRLLILPGLLFLILRAFGVEGLVLGIAVIQMSMPVAVNGSMLCMEYGGDQSCMAQITLVSTAASIVTIPLLAAALL